MQLKRVVYKIGNKNRNNVISDNVYYLNFGYQIEDFPDTDKRF